MRARAIADVRNQFAACGHNISWDDAKTWAAARDFLKRHRGGIAKACEQIASLTPGERDALRNLCRIRLQLQITDDRKMCYEQMLQRLSHLETETRPAWRSAPSAFRSYSPIQRRGVFSKRDWQQKATIYRGPDHFDDASM